MTTKAKKAVAAGTKAFVARVRDIMEAEGVSYAVARTMATKDTFRVPKMNRNRDHDEDPPVPVLRRDKEVDDRVDEHIMCSTSLCRALSLSRRTAGTRSSSAWSILCKRSRRAG